MRLRALLPYSFVLLAACGPEKVEPTATGDADPTIASNSNASTSANEPTTAGDVDVESFGFACVRLSQADGQSFVSTQPEEDDDRFAGTAEIRLTLRYETCLADYYVAHPEQASGGDQGSAIFKAWRPRLCNEPVVDSLVACEVTSISQSLNTGHEMMTITYTITDPAQIAGRTLLWGPGPVAETADCPEGLEPAAKLLLTSDLMGFDADGGVLWSATSSSSESAAIMKHDTQGCIEAEIW
jgi:hypothetical protein